MTSAVIVDAVRTPSGNGKPGWLLSEIDLAPLLSQVLTSLIERTGIDPGLVDDVIGGCLGRAERSALETVACSCTAGTATCSNTPSHGPSSTRASRRSTAAPPKS